MKPFTAFTGVAAPLPIANIDTDQLIPSQYLKVVSRNGLGEGLLAPLRYDEAGRERAEFILNRKPWRNAEILITLENFGCGSSREHAPWALMGFGIKAVVAPSFADIFFGNAVRNGLLPAAVDAAGIERLLALAGDPATASVTIDLVTQGIMTATGEVIPFEVPAQSRDALLNGLDEIESSLQCLGAIEAYEAKHLREIPAIPRWPELSELPARI